ncbi:serine/threonine-protein kinase, partial [Actinomadura viridis]|uniref:serine/threonine-protein kinase n=1 Tax=Actinomadura viridis TaxID=58110 RepID=UPI0031EBEC74
MPEAQPLQPEDPGRLGAYELAGRLGTGMRGPVFLGTGPGGGLFAIKLLARLGDGGARARFLREASLTRQVARFCTAQVLDAGLAGDRPYLVSEYVPGPSLSRAVTREGPVGGGALERLAVNTASALAAIHRAGIAHRVFGPSKVLLGPDGPRVIGFGPAVPAEDALLDGGVPDGDLACLAPERLVGETAGAPADVFAWGATMAFAATGRLPFGSGPYDEVAGRVRHDEPDLGGMEGDMRELVAASLAKDPARRPTAEQVLLRLVGGDGAFAPPGAGAAEPAEPAGAEPAGPEGAGSPPDAPDAAEGAAEGAGPSEAATGRAGTAGAAARGAAPLAPPRV